MHKAPDIIADIRVADESGTAAFAARLAPLLAPGDVVALDGTLGAGKTALARALINALPGPDEDVPSPTFTLVQTYDRGELEIWHFDLYRIEQPEDAFELGIEDAFADAVSLIEWPDRLGSLLPARHLRISIAETDGGGRRIILQGEHRWKERLQQTFAGAGQHG
ncbi:MAG: tRNA (adenosine(37)-N6)-threonylcarbamoyltransferase complex ATPase subunit type 1 TsaE [Rhodospirillales bacterium]|nr:tRNA (adenosine(37)-N6)-threonylcarbamoyltransferase complex ATPase subunit type 1 TsaE [Rhodospirillales bacterium]MBO6785388.1 tRNA (adenosine(37)-N6)-threonylcarbamoyltransferase complex ATPase subunit type 1 TsaE [Rhodospirillales bacterium]